ncbi:MAG: hypothetical protein OXU69_10285 [Gemmatimonadota bacterium]|nr:hypothetical protein [Gemmatimonadota bacterium]MDE2985082.1 hypothetical protein [Gemmatimonadota bacterium]
MKRCMIFAAVAVFGAACASGGGGVREVTQAEAEVMGALFGGTWVLDESASSPQIPIPRPKEQTFTVVVSSEDRGRIPPQVQEAVAAEEVRQATYRVVRRRPKTLTLRVDGSELDYATPGRNIAIRINGGSSTEFEQRHQIRTRVRWDGVRLEFDHVVGSDGRVNEVLEVVDGRLRMTRTLRVAGEAVPSLVLVYDRDRGR